jgi:hypothetical protein
MNKIVLVAGTLVAILLLAPYVGINLFGSSSPPLEEQAPQSTAPAREQKSTEPPARKPKQARVEDLLAPQQNETNTTRKLSDIENLLKDDGQNK